MSDASIRIDDPDAVSARLPAHPARRRQQARPLRHRPPARSAARPALPIRRSCSALLFSWPAPDRIVRGSGCPRKASSAAAPARSASARSVSPAARDSLARSNAQLIQRRSPVRCASGVGSGLIRRAARPGRGGDREGCARPARAPSRSPLFVTVRQRRTRARRDGSALATLATAAAGPSTRPEQIR